MVEPSDIIVQVGEALYGPRFQSDLANDLGVNDRTMRRWVSGDSKPPVSILQELLSLVKGRETLLKSVEHLIRVEMKK